MNLGNVSQWGEVKKKTKDRARSKVKEPGSDGPDASQRGGSSRAGDTMRGGRGRISERGRGGGRGQRGVGVNGTRKPPVTEAPPVEHEPAWEAHAEPSSDGWDQQNQGGSVSPDASWEVVTASEAAPPTVTEAPKPSLRPDGSRSWASMLKPTPKPKVIPTTTQKTVPAVQEPQPTDLPNTSQVPVDEPKVAPAGQNESAHDITEAPSSPVPAPSEPGVDLTPPKDQLTERNLEQVLDVSSAAMSTSAASTAGTNGPRSTLTSVTPLQPLQQPTAGPRPGLGGFATTALKATSGSGRSSSFQRRLKEQQEAVVMPGNHAVDRAAVQFGSMGLGGNADDADVDEEREEAETRTQPPQHSPIAPRASLPPVPQQPTGESIAAPRAAPGLPPVATQSGQVSQSDQTTVQPPQSNYGYNQFNNLYGSSTSQPEQATQTPKAFEPFGQQAQATGGQQPYDGFPTPTQAPGQQPQTSHQSQLGGFSSAANDYSSYYTSDSQKNAYQNFYGTYGAQNQTPQDAASTQQRGTNAFAATTGADHPSSHATSQPAQQQHGRFSGVSEAQNSGHSTPNPVAGPQSHGQSQTHQSHQMGQNHSHAGHHGGYPYGGHPYFSPYNNYSNYMNQVSHHSYGRDRPMFDDVRRYDEQYLTHNNQFGYGGSQGGYGSGPYGAGGKYGQPHQGYGISPQSSFDPHSASPANVGGYGQQPHSLPARDSTSAVGSYGRAGSTQPSENQQQHSSNTFGGMQDVFGRSQSGFSAQTSQQQSSQQSGNEDASRGFTDTGKGPNGPSPAPSQANARPGSAANNMSSQGGPPSSQAQSQQAYGAYPSQIHHQMHGGQSHYGSGISGLGSHHQHGAGQNHQNSGYGGAYAGGFGGNFYGNSNRGGWGGSYGH